MTSQPQATDSLAEAVDAFTDRIDSPLFVVTVSADGAVSGCLAGFVTKCSIQPPRFLVCISKVNHTYAIAEASTGLGLHLLGQNQTGLASLFGEQTGDKVDKFEHCAWRRGSTGAPLLDQCGAWLEGSIIGRLGVGDHEAFVIRVIAAGRGTHSGTLTLSSTPHLPPGHPADG